MSDSLTMSFDPDPELAIAAYETDDDVGKVLRVHLMIEGQIDTLINESTRAKADRRTSFWSKVNLLRAMGVPEKLCLACEALNDLRNQFAHNPKATIANTKTASEKFLGAVRAFFPKLPEAHGSMTRAKAGITYEFTFGDASQAQRIVIAASFLSGVIGALPKMYQLGEPQRLAIVAGFDP